ncbi:MAG: hypothetical protein HQK65_10605, partial [Desulfamplus sp.]|nr:hypothetical protein [Desulfamplus sp.]
MRKLSTDRISLAQHAGYFNGYPSSIEEHMFQDIAIIGQSCVLPEVNSITEFAQIIHNGKVVISSPDWDDWRVPVQEFIGGDHSDYIPDHSFTDKGGYVRNFHSIFKQSEYYRSENDKLDNVFNWSLYCAGESLKDAGITDQKELKSTGLVMSNLSYPTRFFAKLSEAYYLKEFLEICREDSPIDARNRFMSGYPARYIRKQLAIVPIAFALDSACASSLYAIKYAC